MLGMIFAVGGEEEENGSENLGSGENLGGSGEKGIRGMFLC